jgi:modification methylase
MYFNLMMSLQRRKYHIYLNNTLLILVVSFYLCIFANKSIVNMLEEYLNKIINGDCLEVMRKLPDSCIDVVVTSPPYNLKNSTGNGMKDGRGGKWANAALIDGYENYDDCMPNEEYAKWQHVVLLECLRVIKDDGAIFYNHKWRVQAGLIQDRRDIVYDVPLRQIIIWKRKGGINFNAGYFLPTYEVIYLIAKKDFKLAPHMNRYGDVWEIMQEQRNDHPAPFPVELIDRIISSTTGQIILDPFMGSGTTAVVAAGLGRDFIGIEKSDKYCEAARERLEKNKINPEVAKFHQMDLFSAQSIQLSKPKKKIANEYRIESLF